MAPKALADCRLYAFVDTAYLAGRDVVEVAEALCDGGADVVQFRAKGRPREEVLRGAEALASVLARHGVWFVVNDHPDVAAAVGAPLCHLGQEDFFDAGYAHVSRIRPSAPELRFGLSTHAPAQAERALHAGPAYIAVGPVFPTPTKPGRPAASLEYVRWAAAHVTLPWFAIGGIRLDTVDAVLGAGARRICVVSAILNHSDIAAACCAFRRRLESAGQPDKPAVPFDL